jgi:HEAT repeat protein
MRCLHLLLVPGLLLWGQSSTLSAQVKKAPTSQALEIGGHNLEYWISQVPSKDQSQSETAIRMITLFGPERAYEGLPAILNRLRKHPFTLVDTSVVVNGAIAVGYILGNYRSAEPKVVKDAVIILKRFLSDNQSIVRYRAAQALGRIGFEAREAVPEMISVTKDRFAYETRQAAAIALGIIAYDRLNGPSRSVLNALYERLADNSHQVRLAAIQALTALGPPADPTLRIDLVKALDAAAHKEPEPNIKIWAHMAVMSVKGGPPEKERLEYIAHMLTNSEMVVRMAAAQALGTAGKDSKFAIPLLLKAATDHEPMVGAWSIWALGRIGPAAGEALPMLETVKADTNQPEILRNLAKDAIDMISAKKK